MNSDITPPAEDAALPADVSSTVLRDLLKKEPVLAGYLALWILTNVGALLIGHTHLVDSATWTAYATTLTPILTGLILGALSWLTRRVVEPLFKKL